MSNRPPTTNLGHKIKKWLHTMLSVANISFFACIFIFLPTVVNLAHNLPTHDQLELYDPSIITRLYARDGSIVSELADEKRIFVRYHDIPPHVIHAFISAEDKNFFHHHGIDIQAIIKATFRSMFNVYHNKRAVGGSTITQQIVKYFLLNNERTITRKAKEMILACRIDNAFTKEKVMELYLNQIFLGNNSYGIAAAAQNYFHKDLGALSLTDAAMLAALPKAPSTINPFRHYDRAMQRRNWVIDRMAEESYITTEEAKAYQEYDIILSKRNVRLNSGETFYTEIVKQELIDKYGKDVVYNRGLIVNVNLDEKLQQAAENAMIFGLQRYDKLNGWRGAISNIDISNHDDTIAKLQDLSTKHLDKNMEIAAVLSINQEKSAEIILKDGNTGHIGLETIKWARKRYADDSLAPVITKITDVLNVGDVVMVKKLKKQNKQYALDQIPEINGGMVVMEPYSGNVLSVVGGYNQDVRKNEYFNRATQASRQSGSAFKTLVYLAAIENGFTRDSLAYDSPLIIYQGAHLPFWIPKNVHGKFSNEQVSLEEAFRRSINLPTIRFLLATGVGNVLRLSERLSVHHPIANKKSYSLALGSFETTLISMTNAYNIIASNGYQTKPRFIDSVYDKTGNLLSSDESMMCSGCSNFSISEDASSLPDIVYFKEKLIQDQHNADIVTMLRAAMKDGTGRRANVLHKDLAGKTGTTNNNCDSWFIGFSADFTVGIYVGFDQPRSMGHYATGSSIALPIFIEFMKNAVSGIPDRMLEENSDTITVYPINFLQETQQRLKEEWEDSDGDDSGRRKRKDVNDADLKELQPVPTHSSGDGGGNSSVDNSSKKSKSRRNGKKGGDKEHRHAESSDEPHSSRDNSSSNYGGSGNRKKSVNTIY